VIKVIGKYVSLLVISFVCCTGFLSIAHSSEGPVFIYSDKLFDVATVGSNYWVAGHKGVLFYSADRGKNWTPQDSGTDEALFSVCFVDSENGWVVGDYGIIIHTSDGGKSWTRQESATENLLRTVFFIDKNRGWAVGTWSTVLITEDGGRTWTDHSIKGEVTSLVMDETDRVFTSVFFTDPLTGWIAGEFSNIFHTRDGGQTWTRQTADVGKNYFTSIYFRNDREGWILGQDGLILSTTDGGENWSVIKSGTKELLLEVIVKRERGFVVGNKGVILVSSNGGRTWDRFQGPGSDISYWWFGAIDVNGDHGIIVGGHATILLTDSGGKEWHSYKQSTDIER